MLYKKSGLLGISGISNDMRDLLGSSEPDGAAGGGLLRLPRRQGDRRARRGARRRRRRSCSPPASARTRAEIRQRICEASAWLGIELDAAANAARRPAHLARRQAASRPG